MNEKTTTAPKGAPRARVSATRIRAASRAPNATAVNPADLTVHNHPLALRHYRVATTAIEGFVDLVERCVRVLIPGALIYARHRMGKTHAIDYLALHLGRSRGDILVMRMSCEYHRSDYEGSFFSALLSAAGVRDPQPRTIGDKRFALMRRLNEQLQMRSGHIVVLIRDEAQRMSKHALEWLRDAVMKMAMRIATKRELAIARVLCPLGSAPLTRKQAESAGKLLGIHWATVYHLRRAALPRHRLPKIGQPHDRRAADFGSALYLTVQLALCLACLPTGS